MKPSPALAIFALSLLTTALPGCAWKSAAQRDADERNSQRFLEGTDTSAFIAAAEAAVRAGDKAKALEAFGRAIEVNPTLTAAHMGMADLYRMDGDFSKAEVGYRDAARTEPRNFDAQYFHGLMLHVLNRVSDAIQAYLRALSVRPDDFNANLNVGAAYYQLAEYGQALPFALKATRLESRNGAARFSLGAIYAGLGRHQEAIGEYEQALDNNAELPAKLLLNLSASYGALQRFAEMRNTLERLIKIEPSPAAFERLGFARFRLEDMPQAIAAYSEALKLDKDYFPALNGLGVCELNTYLWSDRTDSGARERALTSLRRSLQITRNQPRVEELLRRYGK